MGRGEKLRNLLNFAGYSRSMPCCSKDLIILKGGGGGVWERGVEKSGERGVGKSGERGV